MPWNNQGGGGGNPWGQGGGGGGGPRNPWGQRPPGGGGGGGGGPTPPDLEEMLRRSQDRLRNMLPKGLGGGKGIAVLVVLLAVVWLATGFYRIQPNEQGIVLRFGAYAGTSLPGLNWHLPSPVETVTKVPVTNVNRTDVGFRGEPGRGNQVRDVSEESLMLTADENIIDIDFTVLWRISDARAYLFNVRRPEETVAIAAESAMREVIGRTNIQDALTVSRNQIEQATANSLQQILDEYQAGVEVTEVQLQAVDPPTQVIDAFNDVQSAKQEQVQLRNQAEAQANRIIPEARGTAQRRIQEAEAYKAQVVAQATGDAQRFLSVLAAYRLAPEVTARRLYLETIEEVFGGTNKVIIDSEDGAGGQGVVPYLPLDQLQRGPRAAVPTDR